jgi:hypothetical protein
MEALQNSCFLAVTEKKHGATLAMRSGRPILGSTKKFVSTLTTDVLAGVLRQSRKVGANFARPFSLFAVPAMSAAT